MQNRLDGQESDIPVTPDISNTIKDSSLDTNKSFNQNNVQPKNINKPKTSKNLSFPNALVGNPDGTRPPTKTFGGDNLGTSPKYKSRFKSWIRTVALIVLFFYLPDQVSWSFNYNPAVLWKDKFPRQMTPSEASPEEISAAQIAASVDHILRQVAGKKNPRIQLKISDPRSYPETSKNLSFPNALVGNPDGTRPPTKTFGGDNLGISSNQSNRSLFLQSNTIFTARQINEIYNWITSPKIHPLNCGIYALKDLLANYQINISLEELSVLTLMEDLMNNIIKPGQEKLKTSLFAINKVADAYDLNFKSFKLEVQDILKLKPPFIANFHSEHFVTVTKIDEKNVYFSDLGKSMFLSREDFGKELTGFVLAKNLSFPNALVGNPDKTITGPPTETFGGDSFEMSS